MVLDATMRKWMKERSVETGDAGEYISSLCRSSGMSNEPHCLESLGLLETKNMFLTRDLEFPEDLLFVLSRSLASACHVGFECLGHWLVAIIADHAA